MRMLVSILEGSQYIFIEITEYKYFSLIQPPIDFEYTSDSDIVPSASLRQISFLWDSFFIV